MWLLHHVCARLSSGPEQQSSVCCVCLAHHKTGSIFELAAKNPIFGVVGPDSPLYTPILGLFIVTGFPMVRAPPTVTDRRCALPSRGCCCALQCAYLFIKGVTAANLESERADKLDGL